MFQKGNKLGGGKKGQSGRKTKEEEFEKVLEKKEKEITQKVLISLAKSKVYKQLKKISDFKKTQIMALPIVLKDIGEKIKGDKDNPLVIQSDLDEETKNILNQVIAKRKAKI